MFSDLFSDRGRRSVPVSVVATVMVLQRLEGCSDREACDRFTFDLRWKYAAGVAADQPGFVHTVLVDHRARLRASADPDRVFRVTTKVAASAGLVGTRRVLDSAPLFDAVTTQDTVTMLRSGVRGMLRAVDGALEEELRGVLHRDDDYAVAGKPPCDWDDRSAREQLVDALVKDANAVLTLLEGKNLQGEVKDAAELLATVAGQDVEQGEDGVFRIARRTAPDRVISVVDPEARHGHKTRSRSFDGYKGHLGIDPDSEIITAAEVGPANRGDAELMPELLAELSPAPSEDDHPPMHTGDVQRPPEGLDPAPAPVVYGDAAYGSGEGLAHVRALGGTAMMKVQPPHAPAGHFPKDRFAIDLEARTVTCPDNVTVALRPLKDGGGYAAFEASCTGCPLRTRCTQAKGGRVITIGAHEALLAQARERQQDPVWQTDYRANRPKVERKLAHMLRRHHGGRRARVRGGLRVGQDWKLRAAAVNLARLAVLGVRSSGQGWAPSPA